MNKIVSPEINEVMKAVNYRPSVSVIMPFEPKMEGRNKRLHALKMTVAKVEKELFEHYPDETAALVTERFKKCVSELDMNTQKKSVAIYVSPVFKKILYLEIPVVEKLIVDESFEIRDLVYCKKELHQYLLLLISGNGSRVILGNTDSFNTILTSSSETVYGTMNDVPEKVANFSDAADRKEAVMDKLLYQIDDTLDTILKAYPLPLFVLGTERITGHFKSITRHGASVIDYIHGNYEEATSAALRKRLQSHVADWKKLQQKMLLNLLEDAAGKRTLATGMKDVWKHASAKRGRLLLVEKNFTYAAQYGSNRELIHEEFEPAANFSCIKDAVDDVIEKVLESGGDVEFTEDGFLKAYQRIALIRYY